MILVMLNQRWIFKSKKIQNLGKIYVTRKSLVWFYGTSTIVREIKEFIPFPTGTLAQRLECSPMARETLKIELDTTLLNTQHYKVRFKGKVEQSWEWSSALPYTLV